MLSKKKKKKIKNLKLLPLQREGVTHVSYCSIVNVACQRKALLIAGITYFYFFCTFNNVFAEILLHFSVEYEDVDSLLNPLATFI